MKISKVLSIIFNLWVIFIGILIIWRWIDPELFKKPTPQRNHGQEAVQRAQERITQMKQETLRKRQEQRKQPNTEEYVTELIKGQK